MPSPVEEARSQGYSDSEILEFVAKEKRADIQTARKEGYSDSEILSYLTKTEAKPKKERSFLETAQGGADAVLGGLASMAAAPIGAAAGIVSNLTSGKFGTKEGLQIADETAQRVSGQIAAPFQPKTEAGQEAQATIGQVIDQSKLAVPIGDLSALSAVGGANVSGQASRGVSTLRSALSKPEPEMAGGGAAVTGEARLRTERAESLPVPIKLTKGQRERTFEQQQFERETAKDANAGKPLRERFSDQNQKILQNFDNWVDQTGAEAGSLRATGEAVDKAVVAKANAAKGRVTAAYEKARQSGDMAEEVDVSSLQKYLTDHEPEAVNAGVLQSAKMKLDRLAKDGKISVNDLEEVRKMVGNLGGKDATNAHFAGELKSHIDALTEGKGGAEYKRARSLRAQYAKEFENVGVVDKLLSKKPGTNDRAVAYEDVFQHSILSGSLDDVRAIRKTLQTGGEKGIQAWKELQGATINHLKEEITKNVSRDERGNPIVSPARLNTLVTALDKDGKLDVLFGKKGAQQIRDVRDTALDIYTSPPGSVNTSNTASALTRSLDAVAGATRKIPVVGWVAEKAAKAQESRVLKGKVKESLDEPMLLKDYVQPEEPDMKKSVGGGG